jgi:DEAD/DEAH box helicase domain-containing protein
VKPFEFVENLPNRKEYAGQIAHIEHLPAVSARWAEPKRPLAPALAECLRRVGITSLYTHQARALDAVRDHKSIVVVTATASGKTLCYNLPVLERLMEKPSANALYLFPTKALAQDQLGKLEKLGLPPRLFAGTYDGDTPQQDRPFMRSRGRLILSNVDMLHMGILPRHTAWGRFFRGLEFVVLDELHVYRGVFGSNVGCVLRRLRRICRHYGADPVFIFTSATIANPGDLARNLAGVEPLVIDDDGAPRGERKFIFWNPPIIGADGTRRSSHSEATQLFTGLVENGIRNITFTRARRSAELILRYAREALSERSPALAEKVMSYRAGYRPAERRKIESGLFSGALLGVVATDALELGVDVGGLDATVLTGYPGTISSTWQQAGRAGRSTGEAISLLVAYADPLDQYLMTHPEYFFGRSQEQVLTNPANPHILAGHLGCAAYELPLTAEHLEEFGPDAAELAWTMAAEDVLGFRNGRFYWMPEEYPAKRVSIRSSSADSYRILRTTGEEVGSIEAGRAFQEVHEGAIYLHAGETFRVRKLDLVAKEAIVEQERFSYYTKTADETDLRVIESEEEYPLGVATSYVGRVEVTNRVVSYRKIELFTDAVQSSEPLDLPEHRYQTDGVWWTIPHSVVRRLEQDDGYELMGSIHAIEHAAISLVPLLASCDRWDVGGISHPYHLDTGGLATIFLYDGYPGGVGIARACYSRLKELLTDTAELLLNCPCESGCPSCIHSPKCGSNNEPLDKQGALRLLSLILG